MREKGFTLIELVVVIGILSLLSASLITYSRAGEKQIVFFKEQSVLTGIIFRAKNLAISTYGRNGADSCGYGIHFNPLKPQEVIIFNDKISNGSCSDPGSYSGSEEDVEKIVIDSRVKIAVNPNNFIFVPPEPKVSPPEEIVIKLELVDDPNRSATITISPAGQITVK
jgi:prepilin-type N-terminal cleavage/methylation domain-containing protein